MIRKLIFNLKCSFNRDFGWRYCLKINKIRDSIYSGEAYPWDVFIKHIEEIAIEFNVPESVVYQDLRGIM